MKGFKWTRCHWNDWSRARCIPRIYPQWSRILIKFSETIFPSLFSVSFEKKGWVSGVQQLESVFQLLYCTVYIEKLCAFSLPPLCFSYFTGKIKHAPISHLSTQYKIDNAPPPPPAKPQHLRTSTHISASSIPKTIQNLDHISTSSSTRPLYVDSFPLTLE